MQVVQKPFQLTEDYVAPKGALIMPSIIAASMQVYLLLIYITVTDGRLEFAANLVYIRVTDGCFEFAAILAASRLSNTYAKNKSTCN